MSCLNIGQEGSHEARRREGGGHLSSLGQLKREYMRRERIVS